MNPTILLLPGDGIGPEVVAAAVVVLRAVGDRFGHAFALTEAPIGGAALRRGLPPLPAETLQAAYAADAILLGAVGDPEFDRGDSHRRAESALLGIRRELKLYANLPRRRRWSRVTFAVSRWASSLDAMGMVVVRELTG